MVCAACGNEENYKKIEKVDLIFGIGCDIVKLKANKCFGKIENAIEKADDLFKNSNLNLTDTQWKNLYSSFAKMSLWDGVDDEKVKEARKEGYQIISKSKTKTQNIFDTLKEYKEYVDKYGALSGVSKKLAEDGVLDDVTNTVIKLYDGIQRWYKTPVNSMAIENYIYNKNVDLSNYKNGYINDQNTGAVAKLKFGNTTMDNNGCEIIAAYNAMKTLGNQKDIRDIAYYFENDGQVLKGSFGTNPYATKRYFEKEGYKVKVIEGEKIIKEKLPKADAYIVSFWNSDDVMEALHTIAMRKKKNGKYELFNYNSNERNESADDIDFVKLFEYEGNVPLTIHCISK